MRFYLGSHEPHWLAQTEIPLFVSHRRLVLRRQLPRAAGKWALDSGGFSELTLFGGWRTDRHQYTAAVRRYQEEIGGMEWAAPQDWMCEPWLLTKTGKTVQEHQDLTRDNLLQLRLDAPDLPIIPVLQGWSEADYLRHVESYQAAGVDLFREPVVGVGSVCRRQATSEIQHLLSTLAALGLNLHGFGVKIRGLELYRQHLISADSLAWSFDARRRPPLLGHTHKNCANCLEFASSWYRKVA